MKRYKFLKTGLKSNRRSTTDMLERIQEIGDKLLEKSLPPKKKNIERLEWNTVDNLSLDEWVELASE